MSGGGGRWWEVVGGGEPGGRLNVTGDGPIDSAPQGNDGAMEKTSVEEPALPNRGTGGVAGAVVVVGARPADTGTFPDVPEPE